MEALRHAVDTCRDALLVQHLGRLPGAIYPVKAVHLRRHVAPPDTAGRALPDLLGVVRPSHPLALLDLAPDPSLIGAPTLLFVLRSSLDGREHADAARALVSRLLEQHADAVLAPRFLELVVADHTHYAWHEAVKDEKLAAAVGAIARGLGKRIVEVKDAHGRKAYNNACAECRKAVDAALLFCGRFELIEKLHRSATCVVWLALDVRCDSVRVVVKFMRNKDQSDREVMEREGLDGAFVVRLVATSEELGELLECTIGDDYCTAAAPASCSMRAKATVSSTLGRMRILHVTGTSSAATRPATSSRTRSGCSRRKAP